MKKSYIIMLTMIFIYMAANAGLFAHGGEKKIPNSAEDVCPLKVGQKIPASVLKTVDGKAFDLNKALSSSPAVVIFYRGGWCPYCNAHLGKLKEIEQKIVDLGYRIFAICPDRPAKLKESHDKFAAKYTLLSDHTMTVSSRFGLAYRMPDDLVKVYKEKYKIDLEADSGETHHMLPVPAAFVIGKDGVIKFSYVNPNYKVRIEPAVLLAAASAYNK
jgi:peroxiredoxin